MALTLLECNNVITGLSGVIESPNFPDPYPHNRNCTWTIEAPRGNKVNASFSHFEVEDPTRSQGQLQCTYDYLKAWETSVSSKMIHSH